MRALINAVTSAIMRSPDIRCPTSVKTEPGREPQVSSYLCLRSGPFQGVSVTVARWFWLSIRLLWSGRLEDLSPSHADFWWNNRKVYCSHL